MINEKEKPYSFWPSEAVQHGIEKAVILYNLRFWLTVNKAAGKEKHYHDGKWWTYNTAKALENLMPFFNRRSISRWLSELEKDGVLLSGMFNKVAYDRTKWYTIPAEFSDDAIGQNDQSIGQDDQSNGQDDQWNGQNGQPIPDCNPVSNPVDNLTPPTGSASGDAVGCQDNSDETTSTDKPETVPQSKELFETQTKPEVPPTDKTINIPFDDWWRIYGKKIDRKKCERKWNKLSNKTRLAIMEHTPKYVRATPDAQYRKNPSTYLNSETWNDEQLPTPSQGWPNPSYPTNQNQTTVDVDAAMAPKAVRRQESTPEQLKRNQEQAANLLNIFKGD